MSDLSSAVVAQKNIFKTRFVRRLEHPKTVSLMGQKLSKFGKINVSLSYKLFKLYGLFPNLSQ